MKYIVSLNYKEFVFYDMHEAGMFATRAKLATLDDDLRIKIEITEDPDDLNDPDNRAKMLN